MNDKPVVSQPDHGAQEAQKHGIERSPDWPRVQKEHLQKHPACVACGPSSNPAVAQVHHIFPFHYCVALGRGDLELDERNLITLCQAEEGQPAEDHHLLIGHLADFRSSNVDVEGDARRIYFGMTASQIRSNAVWEDKRAARLKPLEEMDAGERAEFRKKMDARFPKLGAIDKGRSDG